MAAFFFSTAFVRGIILFNMIQKLALPVVTLIFFGLTIFLSSPSTSTSVNKFLSPPPEGAEYFHFGFRESMADSFWLRWIQDSDVCQTYGEAKSVGDEHKDTDKLTANPRHKNCDQSWGYKMLDVVSKLAPRFSMVYWAGAPTLSILVEDYEGSTALYERGLKVYPNDWKLLYRAAYHFQFDKKDLPRAAELLNRAGDNGAPIWVKSLAARLYTAAGQLELGVSTLEAYKKTLTDDAAIKKVDARIQELRRQLQP